MRFTTDLVVRPLMTLVPPFVRALTALLLMVSVAHAFEPFEVRDIRVEGVQRVEAGTVFNYLPVRVGETMTNEKASEAIRALYATGFFRDVRLEVEQDVLIVFVNERPAIASLEITGAKEFGEESLKSTLSGIGLAPARIFDRSVLERAEQAIKEQYLSRGKYGVTVTTTVTPLERNRVGLNMTVDEGDTARIASIRFVGNTKFSEAVLLDELRLSTPTWLTWYTRNDQYAREKLAADLESVRSFYLDRGYLEFSVESTQVSITPNKEDVHITVVVKEGRQYTISSLQFAGQTLNREDEFKELLAQRPGQVFSGSELNETRRRIVERLGELGYAFANVNAQPDLNRDAGTVDFSFLIDPGRRVYVRRINIRGNSRTRDTVIRRELRQFENAWYDVKKIRLSRERIGRLGYFSDVRIDTEPVAGVPDQVDLVVQVVENATGNILFGIGTSSTESVILSGSFNQQNFLGTGKSIGIDVNTSAVNRQLSLSYIEPYFTQNGVSRAVSLYSRQFNAAELDLGDYQWRSSGLGLKFSVPYTEIDRISFGMVLENNRLKLGDRPPERYADYVSGFTDPSGRFLPGVGDSSTTLLGQVGWIRDSRDNAFAPNKGHLRAANLEFTLPAGELRYYKATYNQQFFYPLSRDYTMAFNLDLGYARPVGDRQFPPFKNFYAGGIGSVRGFAPSSLGPGRDPVDNTALGGLTKIVANLEFLLPLAGTGKDRSFRWFTFLDGGNVFPAGRIDTSLFKYSAGVGVTWISPIGAMKFSLGYPLNREPGDDEQRLQFQIGSGF
ncbi:MAG: outer membrane protein assembly factor BamA [Burkholderiaceae bacterium]